MDDSIGSDRMDWEEDSSLHIIQPASSPWRKRCFDTYNDTNEPYDTRDAYSVYQVTDTLRNHTEVLAPLTHSAGRPAQHVTDYNGNIILQPIIQPQPRPPTGYYLIEWVNWIIFGAALLVLSSVKSTGNAYVHTATVAVRVGNSAKRRLVEVTRKTFAPTPPPRRHFHDVPPHRRRSPLIRRVSPTSSGGRTHIPVTPPKARPRATITEAATFSPDCTFDYTPSSIEHVRSGAFVTSFDGDHLMSGVTHPYFEPLMTGALQNIEMDEDTSSNITSSVSPCHIPGRFPDSPAPALPSTKSPIPDSQDSDRLAISHDTKPDEFDIADEQAADDVATPRSEASEEPDIPMVQPTNEYSLQPANSRSRNYKGELLDDWQIKVCREFQAIHPTPREIRQQAACVALQPQGPNSTGLIASHRSPVTNVSPITHHQQHRTTDTGLNDSHRSPKSNVPSIAAAGTMDWHESTTELLQQPHGMTPIGSNDLHRSPLDPYRATPEVLHHPHALTFNGSNDLHRSPLDVHRATTEILDQPRETASFGSNDIHRSPLADVSPMRVGNVMNDSDDKLSGISYGTPKMATVGSIISLRSPLAPLSSGSSSPRINSIGLTDSPQSLLDDKSPIHMQPRLNNSLGSSLAASYMEAAADAITDTHWADPNVLEKTQGEAHVPLRNSPTSPLATMTTAPANSPPRWSIGSLYARVQGKPKKRSPLRERVNNGNIHKVLKTPKKVTWPKKGPVTGTKRFVKHEPMSHPSPTSSREDSSILSSVPSDFSPQPSPTLQEKEALLKQQFQTHPSNSANDSWSISQISSNNTNVLSPSSIIEHTDAIYIPGEEQIISSSSSSDNEASVQSVETPTKTVAADPLTPPSRLSPKLEDLTISTRRSSLRRREKEDEAQRLRDAIAAEEKALKEKEEAEEKARKDKEEAEERARIKAEEEEERKKTGGRRIPTERVIQSLPTGWDEKVRINMAKGMREQLAMTSVGNPLTRRDFGMVLPQPGTGDDPSGWLNDEIISGYLQAVVDHGHRAMGHPRGAKPRMHAFSPFFYTTLKERGYDAVKRWSSRAKIGGNDLKHVEYVFIPCNPTRSHWTLVVVSPVRKTIEVFDSMHGASLDKVNTTKSWLRGELGRSYVDSEWTVIEDPGHPGRGKGPVQNNANDCGVFAVTTAKMLVLGVDPMAVSASDMPLQRRRLVAELLNGGFSGEFEPRIVFE